MKLQLTTLNYTAEWSNNLEEYQNNAGHPLQEFYYDRLISGFVEQLEDFLAQKPLLLLIDNSHEMTEDDKKLLEGVLRGVYRLNRLFVVLCGRRDCVG